MGPRGGHEPDSPLNVSSETWEVRCELKGQTWGMMSLCSLSFQAQSQGSITLKIVPATQEEDRLKESKVWGAGSSPAFKRSFGRRVYIWSLEHVLSRLHPVTK